MGLSVCVCVCVFSIVPLSTIIFISPPPIFLFFVCLSSILLFVHGEFRLFCLSKLSSALVFCTLWVFCHSCVKGKDSRWAGNIYLKKPSSILILWVFETTWLNLFCSTVIEQLFLLLILLLQSHVIQILSSVWFWLSHLKTLNLSLAILLRSQSIIMLWAADVSSVPGSVWHHGEQFSIFIVVLLSVNWLS